MKRKDSILKTALAVFNKMGYEHVSTYDISRKLKIFWPNSDINRLFYIWFLPGLLHTILDERLGNFESHVKGNES